MEPSGSISTKKKAGKWTATTRFRDEDGRTRQVSARGESKAACIRNLKVKIAGRTLVTEGDITGETRVEVLCEMYLEAHAMQVDAEKITPTTRDKEVRQQQRAKDAEEAEAQKRQAYLDWEARKNAKIEEMNRNARSRGAGYERGF